MSLPTKTLLGFVVFALAFLGWIGVFFLKKNLKPTSANLTVIETARRQLTLARSQETVYFFSSVKGISLRPGKNTTQLLTLLQSSKIFGKKTAIFDETQNTGGFTVDRIIFELVDTPQPYYEQRYLGESESSISFGIAKYDDQTLLVKIAFSKKIFAEMNSEELTWMLYTRAREILKIWEYRERFASISEFTLQKQEVDALIQAQVTEVFNTQGVEAFPAVILKAEQ